METVNDALASGGGTFASDIASTANGEGASLVGIEDPDDLFVAEDVEGALVEPIGSNRIANVADAAGGVAEIFRTTIPSGANGDTDITLDTGHKIRVLDAGLVLKGAGTAGSTVTLKSTATAISDVIDVSAGGDKAVFRPSTIDDSSFEIAGGGKLRWSHASTGGDFPGAEAWVLAVRVA